MSVESFRSPPLCSARRAFVTKGPGVALSFQSSTAFASQVESRVSASWRVAKPVLESRLAAELRSGKTQALYFLQLDTANILMWAAKTKAGPLLRELSVVYSRCYEYLVQVNELPVFYWREAPASARISNVKLNKRVVCWLPEQSGVRGPEDLLSSSHFLYSAVRLLRATIECGSDTHDGFRVRTWEVSLAHLTRWLFGEGGVEAFQVAGWKCNPGNFTHEERVSHLEGRAYGLSPDLNPWKNAPRHCNAITDSDLFICMLASEILVLHRLRPTEFQLSSLIQDRIHRYTIAAYELIWRRHEKTRLVGPRGGAVVGALFEAGMWREHPDYRYSGDEDSNYPGWAVKGNPPARPARASTTASWDISHARRFVLLVDTNKALSARGIETALSTVRVKRIVNQLILGPWNRSLSQPKFANFIDGSNGWYRVNYVSRPNFGIAPYGNDKAYSTYGYFFLRSVSSDVTEILTERMKFDSFSRTDPQRSAIQELLAAPCFSDVTI